MLFCSAEPMLDKVYVVLRGLDAVRRLLLKRVQHVDCIQEPDRVHSAVCAPIVVSDDLQNSRSTKALQRLRVDMLAAPLGTPEREADRVSCPIGKAPNIVST